MSATLALGTESPLVVAEEGGEASGSTSVRAAGVADLVGYLPVPHRQPVAVDRVQAGNRRRAPPRRVVRWHRPLLPHGNRWCRLGAKTSGVVRALSVSSPTTSYFPSADSAVLNTALPDPQRNTRRTSPACPRVLASPIWRGDPSPLAAAWSDDLGWKDDNDQRWPPSPVQRPYILARAGVIRFNRVPGGRERNPPAAWHALRALVWRAITRPLIGTDPQSRGTMNGLQPSPPSGITVRPVIAEGGTPLVLQLIARHYRGLPAPRLLPLWSERATLGHKERDRLRWLIHRVPPANPPP